MNSSSDIREFLTSRRAKITPEQAGLPSWGERRVPGLRREEVAALAGVSLEYYKRLERGNLAGVSDGVIEALARALQLSDAERAHLYDLARAAGPAGPAASRRPIQQRIRPAVAQMLDAIASPATVRNARCDYLAANALGRALYAPVFESAQQPANSARFLFLDPTAADFYPRWELIADELVANLRSQSGAHPRDRPLRELIDELCERSDEFRVRWAAHNVGFHQTGSKQIRHPLVGELTLSWEAMELSADSALTVAVYSAVPGSASAQALDLLASWIAAPA